MAALRMLVFGSVAFFSIGLSTATAQDVTYCSCKDMPVAKGRSFDLLLSLDQWTRAGVIATHTPWGLPESPSPTANEALLVQQHYIIYHDGDLRVPLWGAYRLTADDVSGAVQRQGCFRQDPRLEEAQAAVCGDYAEPSGIQPRYDRGHLVPAGDMTRSEAAMHNTFVFSNMTPQHDNFNTFQRGIWEHLESRVRDWAEEKAVLYIIAGSIFDKDGDGQRDPDSSADLVPVASGEARVAIPTHFYKIVLHPTFDGGIESLAFLLEHVDEKYPDGLGDETLKDTLASISEIESITGISFLPDLASTAPVLAATVKDSKADELW